VTKTTYGALFVAILCAGSAFCTESGIPQETYLWPLDLPRVVTSSFGEYRGGRFHAGIDLRTGDIGKPVRAPADGYVSRVRCSPWGFGKAVYVHIEDGHSVVFGHLNDFAPVLRDYVRRIQHEKKNYTVDLFPEARLFPVKAGEVIAYSGETGIGPAHLHYEIRDDQERPMNPRLLGITWPDATPPKVQKALVMPASPDSRIRGDILPLVLKVKPVDATHYTCDPIEVSGAIGFGLDVIDPANEGANILGIYRLRAKADGKEIFRVQMDRFAYDDRDNETVSYHPFLLSKGRFMLLWRWPGNVSAPYQQTSAHGWYKVPDKPVLIEIEAEDFFGNAVSVAIPLKPSAGSKPVTVATKGTGKGSVSVDNMGTWLALTASFTVPEPEFPMLVVDGARSSFERVNEKTFRAGFVPRKDQEAVTLRVEHPRISVFEQHMQIFHRGSSQRTITLAQRPEGLSTAVVKSNSPYGVLFFRAYPARETSSPPLPMLGEPVRLWPALAPIDDPIELSFPTPPGVQDAERLAIYRDVGKYWTPLDTEFSNGRLVALTQDLGAFAVLEDNLAPTISEIVPSGPVPASEKRPKISAKVSDTGSGMRNVTVTCDGQWLLVAYDPERGRIEWEQDEDLPDGPWELVFTAIDEAGNTKTVTRKVEVGVPKPKAVKPVTPSKPSKSTKSKRTAPPVKTKKSTAQY